MAKIVVYHASYGCDTGCCGHYVELFHEDTEKIEREFHFDHPRGDESIDFAKELITSAYGAKHVADLDWDHCWIVDD